MFIQNWKAHLEKKELFCLRKLLDKPVREILSPLGPAAKAAGGLFSTPNISFCVDNDEYVIIGNERSETPNLAMGYWIMFVQQSNTPDEIRYEGRGAARPKTLNRKLFAPDSPITRIEVYEGYESLINRQHEETVHYDHALVFYLKNNRRFCISAQPSQADQVEFTADEALIDKIIEGCSLRVTLKH